MGTTIGIDIGGSHITAAIVDMETRMMQKETCVRRSVDSKGCAEEIIEAWCSAISDLAVMTEPDQIYIGMAMPGPFDYGNGISLIHGLDKYESLYGLNVKEFLGEKLGIYPDNIRMLNDAACFLQGEIFAGAVRGYDRAIGITLGTGVGTARFNKDLAEEAGAQFLPFLKDVAEEYLSTRWFIKRYREMSGLQIANVKVLAELYESSAIARDIFKEFSFNLAMFIAQFVKRETPQAVVLGGNIISGSNLFLSSVKSYLLANQINIPIYMAALNEEAAILGAASLWDKQELRAY
jgi:glucokinase